MLAEVTKKQRELDELMDVFQGLRTFVLELRRSTRNKNFQVANSFAWESVLACNRMLVIDLAAWVDSLLPPRPPKKGELGWLRENLTGAALLGVSSERSQDAMLSLFGKRAAHRGHPIEKDVIRLENRLFRWAENLRKWRNTHAHRYGLGRGSVRALRQADLARRFTACGRMMNHLRVLIDNSGYIMSRLEPSEDDACARDLVDIIVTGTIPFAVEEWGKEEGRGLWQKRDAHYARLHRHRRRKRTDSFNRPR